MKSTSRLAIVAAAGMFVGGLALTPAQAADLGGDCCADLEERVADLEATTVRKGNRKVSLKLSGQVNRAITWIKDEEGDSELHAATNAVSGSSFQLSGSAKLTTNWTAGYVLKIATRNNKMSTIGGKGNEEGAGVLGDAQFDVDKEYLYLSHAQFGTFVTGHVGAPTDGVANISLSGRGSTGDSAGADWNGIVSGDDLENGSVEAIAYISPTLAGFTLSVAWADLDKAAAEDSGTDAWDVALRYANEFGPVRIAAGIGYTTVDDDTLANGDKVDGANIMGSIALMHVPTGINVAFAAGQQQDGGLASTPTTPEENAEFWHVEGGINQNFFGIGNTAIYGEYGSYDDGKEKSDTVDPEMTMWGLGISQQFDSAATELYLAYRQWEDKDLKVNEDTDDDNVQQIMAGMKIKF